MWAVKIQYLFFVGDRVAVIVAGINEVWESRQKRKRN
jgi:hypothetical protein